MLLLLQVSRKIHPTTSFPRSCRTCIVSCRRATRTETCDSSSLASSSTALRRSSRFGRMVTDSCSYSFLRVFRRFAAHLIVPLANLLLRDDLGSNGINYIVCDVMATVLSWNDVAIPEVIELFHIFFIFIVIFILLTRRKTMEALIRRVSNYPDLLPEMPRYCYPIVI